MTTKYTKQSALLTVLAIVGLQFSLAIHHEDSFIGWQGEKSRTTSDQVFQASETHHTVNHPSPQPWIQQLSWKPRAFIYHNFLSKDEVRHIMEAAAPQMKRSTVVGPNNTSVEDNYRSSYGTFLRRNQDPVVRAIEERLALWSLIPVSHQEDLQVLRYGVTNKYGPHIDGLGRVATVLMYLVAPDEGGETALTASEWLDPALGDPARTGPLSDCAKGHVAYKPKTGDALMFWDKLPDGKLEDPSSMHTGCPVIKGVKWNAVKWIHGDPFRLEDWERALKEPYVPLPDPGVCIDLERASNCEMWANAGECTKNPEFMVGSTFAQGMCRKSCKSCTDCVEGDTTCLNENRRKLGYLQFDPRELDLII